MRGSAEVNSENVERETIRIPRGVCRDGRTAMDIPTASVRFNEAVDQNDKFTRGSPS